ncbi:MAG: transcription termination/antitermination protein NusG [Clostridia bacterium]
MDNQEELLNQQQNVSQNEVLSENTNCLQQTKSDEQAKIDAEITEEARKKAKWYVVHTYSGYENVAKKDLETVIEKYNLGNRIFDILIPMEDVIEEKNGKKKLVQHKLIPTYMLVKMIYGDDLWHHVVRIRSITGFVGPNGRPLSLTDDEVVKMRLERVVQDVVLEIGDKVEIIGGPLDTMIGKIVALDTTAHTAKVSVEMFGRDTNVDLDFSSLHKIK